MTRHRTTDLARELIAREAFLDEIAASEPVRTASLAETLDTSVSTVNRVVGTFVEAGALERTRSGIKLTATGRALARETARYARSVEAVRSLGPILESLTDSPVEYELDWFLEATVTEATPTDPYAPLIRYSELFTCAERKYIVGDRLVVPAAGREAASAAIDEGVSCVCIWSEQALERIVDQYPELVDWSAGRENLTVKTAERVPFDFAVFDDRLLVYGFDDDTGAMSVLVDTAESDVVEWALTVFEHCRRESDATEVSRAASVTVGET